MAGPLDAADTLIRCAGWYPGDTDPRGVDEQPHRHRKRPRGCGFREPPIVGYPRANAVDPR